MKENIFTAVLGVIGSFIASLFGGWSAALTTLIIFMVIDYMTGLVVAGVFHKSQKSDSGTLSSKASWKGLCKKFMTLVVVIVAYRIDKMAGTTFVKDAVIIAYIANEAISITENAGLMGVPIPAPITKAIEVLKNKDGDGNENNT